jgi:hypothetical protein
MKGYSTWSDTLHEGILYMKGYSTWRGTLHEGVLYMKGYSTWRGTLHEDQYSFVITYLSVLIRMRHISDRSCRENQNTHCTFNNFFFVENRAFYEIRSKNIVQPDKSQMTIWCIRIACQINKFTNTHLEYVALTDFPLQQWLYKRPSILRYTYVTCLIVYYQHLSEISPKLRYIFSMS